MRLIDADKLKEELRANGLGYQYYMLDNAPTVKAISIEWLRELQVRYLKAGCNMSVCVVNEILNLWEKENEHKESD